jgi:hypothetical protein
MTLEEIRSEISSIYDDTSVSTAIKKQRLEELQNLIMVKLDMLSNDEENYCADTNNPTFGNLETFAEQVQLVR